MTDSTDQPPPPTPEEPAPKETIVEIHKPKPIHSFREFLAELGTIVLGICIALAGSCDPGMVCWRAQEQEARKSSRPE